MNWTDMIVTSRRANNDQWHSAEARQNIGAALRKIGEVQITCECGAGPFKGLLGIKAHRRQRHGTVEQIQRAGGRSHASYPIESTRYQDIFRAHHGDGPWSCYFCQEPVIKLLVHHEDHDRTNDDISNLVAAHKKCHNDHHGMGEGRIVTDETRARLSIALRGKSRQLSDNERADRAQRARKIFTGRKQSVDHVAKRTAAARATRSRKKAS